MAAEYTKQDCLKLLKVAAQTFDKWLDETGIDVRIDPADHRRKLLTRAQVEHLAHRYNRTLPPDTPAKLADPLAALESRLRAYVKQEITAQVGALRADILARLEALEASPAPRPLPKAQIPASAPAPVASRPTMREKASLAPGRKTNAFEHAYQAKTWLTYHGLKAEAMEPWQIPYESMKTHVTVLAFALAQGAHPTRCTIIPQCPCRGLLPED